MYAYRLYVPERFILGVIHQPSSRTAIDAVSQKTTFHDFIMVVGSARPLLEALQHATTEMQRSLMEDYGFDERSSSLLMGHMVQYDIANIVDPHFTVVAKIPKSCLTGKEITK